MSVVDDNVTTVLKRLSATEDGPDVNHSNEEGTKKDFMFKDFTLERACSSHPLQTLLGENITKHVPFIFAYRKGVVELSEKEDESFHRDNTADSSSEQLGGSPLKLQEFSSGVTIPNNSRKPSSSAPFMKPVSTNDARYLVSQYTFLCNPFMTATHTDLLPLWVYCDRQEHGDMLFLGTRQLSGKKRGNVLHMVTSRGPVQSIQDVPSHMRTLKKPQQIGNATVKVSAHYDIFGSMNKDESSAGSSFQGSLMVSSSWDRVTTLLEVPPVEAVTALDIQVAAGDVGSAVYSMFRELSILQGFASGLKDGCVSWAVESCSGKSLLEEVQTLTEDLKQGDALWQPTKDTKKDSTAVRKNEDESDVTSPVKSLALADRVDLDFTEKLWNILIDCSSYDELVKCFQYVLRILKNGELQPMVHASNHTQLAELVRASYYNKLVMPDLAGLLPLELLVEIGVEKLRRDYSHAFIDKDLVTADQLTYFLEKNLDLHEKLSRLEKLHNVLELVVMMKMFLNIPQITLSSAARQAMNHYQIHNVDPAHVFHIPVATSAVRGVFDTIQPHTWQVEMISNEQDAEVSSIYHISCKPPVDEMYSEPDTETSSDQHLLYYFTRMDSSVHIWE
ncbi:protein zwilch homolog [Lingula anatina]|uniref:Protein zwilch n=1 Tax=Lingula anatina TaxID=7574 RepID=A0A1S3HHG4_LINAN|nr:protein zwilch homolog [Lingula anatina]|eukprot:XP_013385543.2 protein zwilch homolog [Lingula anatina]